MQSDSHGDRIDIPTKKPRKSQKNPNPQLSDAQKVANKVLSGSSPSLRPELSLATPSQNALLPIVFIS
jgi:hypothetical protein